MLYAAYSAIMAMAVAPIHIGSWASIDRIQKDMDTEEPTLSSRVNKIVKEEISSSDAYAFPLIGSAFLFGLYMAIRYISKEYVNLLLSAYFSFFGVSALTSVIDNSFTFLVEMFNLASFTAEVKKSNVSKPLIAVDFTYVTVGAAIAAVAITGMYLVTKNWVLNNILGIAFAIGGVKIFSLDSFKTGFLLLAGLFLYDIFWVFGTEVMVKVATNIDAPIKLLFPREFFSETPRMAMLGLGDIVIPGAVVALCLRFDYHLYLVSLNKKYTPEKIYNFNFKTPYYNAAVIAYIIGLVTTIVVMHVFKAAQPALLYLSPACIIAPISVAFFKNQLKELFSYSGTQDNDLKSIIAPEQKKNQ